MKPKTVLFTFAFVFVVGAALAGIFRTPAEETAAAPNSTVKESENTEMGASPVANGAPWSSQITLSDEQGAVVVEVTPLNLISQSSTLDFQVSMNTHSVELGMDLTELATLTTDTGLTVTAIKWDAPMSGHHVAGTLSFPAEVDGHAFIENGSTLTLTIIDVDAPERVFIWEK